MGVRPVRQDEDEASLMVDASGVRERPIRAGHQPARPGAAPRDDAALAAERVQLALDAGAIIGTWVWTIPDDRFIADERFAQSFGIDPDAIREGLPLEALFASIHPDDRERVGAEVAGALARGGRYRCEYRVRRAGGQYGWIVASGRVELDGGGKPVRFPGVLLDDDERRRIEAERDRANALLHTFIEAVPGVVYAKDREGRLIVGNRGVADLLGVAPGAFIGKTDRELLADSAQAEGVMANDRRIMESGQAEQVEEEIRRADGTPATWLSTKAPFRDGQGNVVGLIGASLDITDRKRIENALRLSEQRSALALDVARLGTWTLEHDSATITIDARAAQICGVSSGRTRFSLAELARRVHPDDWPGIESALEHALEPGGTGAFAEDFRFIQPGGEVTWAASRGQVRSDAAAGEGGGRVMIGTLLDVSERRRMIESLEQGDRRKDEFLAMLAHELRNPLAPIGTAAHLLQLAPGDTERVREVAGIVRRQVAHMTELVDDLLDVSRVTRGLVVFDHSPVDLGSVIATALEQIAPLLQARGHAVAPEPPACTAVILGDRHRLVQVVSNLLNNAAKFTPAGGRISLACDCTPEQVTLRVSDDGIGMEPELVPHVFDLFSQAARTPDRAQGGLGIGLALVRTIVQAHGGTVKAQSAGPGQGSTFTVVLPRSQCDAPPAPAVAADAPAPHRKSVLVVDDNNDAAETLAVALRLLGHEVSVATGGRMALDMVADRPDWDVFILDIGMPDITGLELAGRLRRLVGDRPARFIALTGYGQAQDHALSRQSGFDCHMVKPADIGEIQRQLALAGRRGSARD
jgi:PAS domain S-box-containing protein